MIYTLRDYQGLGVRAVRQAIKDGRCCPLIVLPTGGGKSIIMGEIIRLAVEKDNSVLWLVHRRNLVTQMRETLTNLGVDSGIIMAGYEPDPDLQVQVGTIQTYSRRISNDKDFNPHFVDADILMIDEAHRSVSPTTKKVIDKYKDKILIGCTATPLRGDGRGLGAVYNDLIEISTVQELTERGFLSPARYFAPTTIDTSGVSSQGGDFVIRQLSDAANNTEINGDVVENWLRLAGDRKTLVFAVDVKHSIALRDTFRAAGVSAEHLDAHSSDDTRDGVFRAMERDEVKVVCNVAVYQEGLDVPGISCVVMARPTKSLGLYKQCCGRGLRVLPGKEDCLILDHGGNIDRLGFLDDVVYWTLDDRERGWTKPKPREKDPKKMTCKECGEIFLGGVRCPSCGSPVKSFGRHVQTYEAELQEIETKSKKLANKDLSWDDKARFMAGLKWHQQKRGYKPGWVSHSYRSVTGVWPNDRRLMVGPVEPIGKALNLLRYVLIKKAKTYQKKGGQNGKIHRL